MSTSKEPIGLFIQPACLQHRYIRHANSSHIFERPERLRAVLLGVATAIARLEEEDTKLIPPASSPSTFKDNETSDQNKQDISSLLSSLSIHSSTNFSDPHHIVIVPPPIPPVTPGQILLHHLAAQISHSSPTESSLPGFDSTVSSRYLKDLYKWASEAVERIKTTGCEIPGGLGLNQGDLYLGSGSILAIEGAIQTVCQAVDLVHKTSASHEMKREPSTPPVQTNGTSDSSYFSNPAVASGSKDFRKAFCAIRPPGHHCGEDTPSGFCYVNNVVTGAMHAYLEHDTDRAIIIDFDLHHGNGTQALVMPLNAASHAEDLAIKAGKPRTSKKRGWKGFYGSVHDIYSYPCEDGDLDLVKDASLSLAAHGQYIENIHLQPYTSEEDFYERIYPKYLALLDKAKVFMQETDAEFEKTVIFISAGFDACEHEHQGMQRHDRRVPTSFFSRYTKDIALFADKYCCGRVVSVLEGGYSDRALTSAALGHVLGMLGQTGKSEWWNVDELSNIEKATKKKRTGKIAPFPSELSHLPHLVRTHALLGHFETIGQPPEHSSSSSSSTPRHNHTGMTIAPSSSRMTLRTRKANGEDEVMTTPPAASRRGRGRGVGGVGTPTTIPRIKKEKSPMKPENDIREHGRGPEGKIEDYIGNTSLRSEDLVNDLLKGIQSVNINESTGNGNDQLQTPPQSKIPISQLVNTVSRTPNPASKSALSDPSSITPSTSANSTIIYDDSPTPLPQSDPSGKIFLRFKIPSPTPSPPPQPVPSETVPQQTAGGNGTLYPRLDFSGVEGRLEYRESSAEPMSSGTEGEYVDARSREGTVESSSSEMSKIPGGYKK